LEARAIGHQCTRNATSCRIGSTFGSTITGLHQGHGIPNKQVKLARRLATRMERLEAKMVAGMATHQSLPKMSARRQRKLRSACTEARQTHGLACTRIAMFCRTGIMCGSTSIPTHQELGTPNMLVNCALRPNIVGCFSSVAARESLVLYTSGYL